MLAFRCTQCGDTRWSLYGLAAEHVQGPCEICGGEVVPERRRPSAESSPLVADRRDAAAGDRASGV